MSDLVLIFCCTLATWWFPHGGIKEFLEEKMNPTGAWSLIPLASKSSGELRTLEEIFIWRTWLAGQATHPLSIFEPVWLAVEKCVGNGWEISIHWSKYFFQTPLRV